MARLAILAGQGMLPQMIAASHPGALFVHFENVPVRLPDNPSFAASFERFGALVSGLRNAGVTDLVLAGALPRPDPDPDRFDARTRQLAPALMAAMAGGDDGLLRVAITALEGDGFRVRAAQDLIAGLTAPPGHVAGPAATAQDLQDAARARRILLALGAADVGQAAVVAAGQCLGIETAQGTDAMLGFVAATKATPRPRARGVLVKIPKPGQDLRADMPAIGPETVAAAARARLAGIVIDAGAVLLLDREKTSSAADRAGIFILAQSP